MRMRQSFKFLLLLILGSVFCQRGGGGRGGGGGGGGSSSGGHVNGGQGKLSTYDKFRLALVAIFLVSWIFFCIGLSIYHHFCRQQTDSQIQHNNFECYPYNSEDPQKTIKYPYYQSDTVQLSSFKQQIVNAINFSANNKTLHFYNKDYQGNILNYQPMKATITSVRYSHPLVYNIQVVGEDYLGNWRASGYIIKHNQDGSKIYFVKNYDDKSRLGNISMRSQLIFESVESKDRHIQGIWYWKGQEHSKQLSGFWQVTRPQAIQNPNYRHVSYLPTHHSPDITQYSPNNPFANTALSYKTNIIPPYLPQPTTYYKNNQSANTNLPITTTYSQNRQVIHPYPVSRNLRPPKNIEFSQNGYQRPNFSGHYNSNSPYLHPI